MKTKITLFAMLLFSTLLVQAQTIMNIHQSNGTVLQIPLNTIDSITYTIPNPGNLATLTTLPIGNITVVAATTGGNITNDGGTPVTQRGVVWSTSPSPTTANNSTTNGSGTGIFTINLTSLTASTTYYLRAYATNSAGTAYGNELSFTTTAGNLATISTTAVNSVTGSTAVSGGNVSNDGGILVTQRGICYSTSPSATTANTTIMSGSGIGSFTCELNGLSYSTTYYARAYAMNSAGTAYGNEVSFTTANQIVSTPGAGVTFDGYTYGSIVLGNGQEWMAENLRTSVYANGDSIPNETNANAWQYTTTGAWVHYNNDSQYENPYGKLYNWYTVNDSRNMCPTGWHVPTDAEWSTFINYLDPNADGGNNLNSAGGKMKSAGTQYWPSPNTDATNESGFSGLPGSYRQNYGLFDDLTSAVWWSSTEYNLDRAWTRSVHYDLGEVWRLLNFGYNKAFGFSVRCLKD